MESSRQNRHTRGGETAAKGSWAAAAALATAQHGAIARRQLRQLGITDRRIDYALGHGTLHPAHRGVFAFGHARLSPMGRWCAAVLACGPNAALGYRSAAAAWALRPSTAASTEVVIATVTRRSHPGLTVRRHATLGADEVTILDGVPITTVARTMLDVGAVLPPGGLRKVVAEAEVRQLFDLREVERLLSRHPRHRGRRPLASVLENWTPPPRVRSVLEERFVAVCARHGLPEPLMNSTVIGMEVDALFPDHGIVVELDGAGAHRGVLHREDDYARRARLVAAGWAFVAFTYRQTVVGDGAFVAQTLRGALRQSTLRPPAPDAHT